ncbi:TRAP transporter substrate-binding protein [Hydrogenophaga sp. 5NK40-0174]|uniref:TRAP transporter substrate-binding protein n=1 Tax=Hydrogenophaga sp. 5NK40-0174 TaxID=3127649 RepID=UPI003103278F
MNRLFVKTVIAAVALAGSSLAMAEKTIKFANQNAAGHPIIQGMEKFAELVDAKSGGKLKVKVFPSGQLGSDQANVTALQAGTIEMASMNSGIFASLTPEMAIFDFPFMFRNGQEADKVVDGDFGQKLHAKLEPKGIVGLGYYELGFRNITNGKRAINTVADIEGLKLRVIPNPINVDWVKALGANPTPLPWPEVYAALEQGAVDGQENPVATILGAKFYEVQKHIALTNHQYNPQSVVVSKKFWEKLSAEEQKVIREAVAESAVFQRKQARAAVDGALDTLKQNGMQVTELPAAEVAKLQEKMKPVVEKHADKVGKETVEALQAELAKLRK